MPIFLAYRLIHFENLSKRAYAYPSKGFIPLTAAEARSNVTTLGENAFKKEQRNEKVSLYLMPEGSQ